LAGASVWRVRWTDLLVVGGLGVCGALGLLLGGRSPQEGMLEIRNSESVLRVPLDEGVRTVPVTGPLGQTLVEIRDGAARVVSSPCRDKVCMRMGWVRAPGDWTACVPNRVVVRVEALPGVDAVTR
jgi:hypothetical protein